MGCSTEDTLVNKRMLEMGGTAPLMCHIAL